MPRDTPAGFVTMRAMEAAGTPSPPMADVTTLDTAGAGVAGVSTDVPAETGRGESPAAAPPGAGALPQAGMRRARWPATRWVVLAAAAVVVAGVVLRFVTTSPLWLDEALTVNISRQPLADLHHLLSRDGAPPLYYLLLHFWMGAFGSSDVAVRALSGLFSVATLPFVYVAGRRIGGRTVGTAALLLVASSPFAIRYATETRMYSLAALLVAAGSVALLRVFDRPRPGNLIAVALCTAALLYTHYWSLYLVSVTGLWLLWRAWRSRGDVRRAAAAALGAMVVGGLAFVPWLPTFVYQSRHTGTPWAAAANFADMVDAITSFAGGPNSEGRALALLLFALGGLGLFGMARNDLHIDLDLRTKPRARPWFVAVVGTLALAIVGGYLSTSAFQARYAMVVFVPLVLLVALGLVTFADRRIRYGVMAVAVVLGIVGSLSQITAQRTQAAQIAAVLAREGRPGDVVALCPDQLGPDVSRLLPAGRYREITFPRQTGPEFVDWVDYAKAVHAASPVQFGERVVSMAGSTHRIWYVWEGGYATYGTKCEAIAQVLSELTKQAPSYEVNGSGVKYYEPENLMRFGPTAG